MPNPVMPEKNVRRAAAACRSARSIAAREFHALLANDAGAETNVSLKAMPIAATGPHALRERNAGKAATAFR
jgi:hypothetical protein